MSEPIDTAAARSPNCVVDASVGVKLFIIDELSDRAHQLFGLLTTPSPGEIFVPDLFYIECANVLWKYVRWAGMEADVARSDLEDLASLSLNVTSTADLMIEALELAVEYSITAYDACYVALSRHLGLQLITADQKLAEKIPFVSWVGDFV